MRDLDKLAALYTSIYQELGTFDEMHDPISSATAMAMVDLEFTSGYGEPDIKKTFELCFPTDEDIKRKQIIEVKNIRFYTRCEHHGLPFYGYVHYFYIPDESMLGLSKPARVVQHYAKRYQMQEKMTVQISEFLWKTVKPVAHVLIAEGSHLCNVMRGVCTPDSTTTTRVQKVNEDIYKEQKQQGALYHLIKDLCNHNVTGATRGVRSL